MKTPNHPAASSPDDDPTGVRALLSALPEPQAMPAYLVERISASLAAEQAQRTVITSGASVAPLIATTRRRPGRLLFAIASAAAAVALIGLVGSNLLRSNQATTASDSAAAAITSGSREASGAAPPSANDKAAPGGALSGAVIQIRSSGIRYTRADFVTQARTFRSAALDPTRLMTADSAGVGPIGTAVGLADCLSAIGANGAQMVRADLAYYDGQPAVIIVATTSGKPTAYAVGHACSRTHAALLHPATTLP